MNGSSTGCRSTSPMKAFQLSSIPTATLSARSTSDQVVRIRGTQSGEDLCIDPGADLSAKISAYLRIQWRDSGGVALQDGQELCGASFNHGSMHTVAGTLR